MFLNQLTDSEKAAFISFSVHAANSDDVFADEEKVMINEYCKEMELDYPDKDNIMSMEDIMAVLSKSDIHNKKIVMFEILGLVYSDGEYAEEEKRFVNTYAKEIGLTEEDVKKQTELIIRYLGLLKEICEIL